MPLISVDISEVEYKALTTVAIDPEEWITNLVKARASIAMDEIYHTEIQRMTADPTIKSIPADRDAVVLAASVLTAQQLHEKALADHAAEVARMAAINQASK
jgi:hypothetical protein